MRRLPKGPFPVMFILTLLGMISGSVIFRLKVFQKAGGGNNEDSGFLQDLIQPPFFSLFLLYVCMEFTI